MDIAFAVVAAVAVAAAAYLWRRHRALRRAVSAAIGRIGGEAAEQRTPDRLGAAVDEMEHYLGQARRERAQLVGALQAANFGVIAVDDAGTVTFTNPAGARFLGARQGEAVAEARIRDLLEKVIVTRDEEVIELDLYTPTRRVLRLRAAPLEHGIESAGAVAFIEDVTEQRRVDAIRTDFVANVGHELKTPLGALSVLAETIADTDDVAVRDKLTERLGVESRRIAHLIDDILDLAQVESFAAAPEPVAIADVLAQAKAQVQLAAEDLGVPLLIEPVPDGVFVAGNDRQLATAVANLLDNAVKYTAVKEEGSGKVTVRTLLDEHWVTVEVRDEGIGIPERHLDRIFERFYRVDKARSRDTGGTGLGLAIVRHVALNHGGEIRVSSEEGRGSTFALRLPPYQG